MRSNLVGCEIALKIIDTHIAGVGDGFDLAHTHTDKHVFRHGIGKFSIVVDAARLSKVSLAQSRPAHIRIKAVEIR